MANLVTMARILLLFVLVGAIYALPAPWSFANAFLAIVVIALDAVDGYLARRRGEVSLFGSTFDVAADRIVENVLWIVLADLRLVPVWVAIVFVTRSFIVDGVRGHGLSRGEGPFEMMRSRWGRRFVAGRFMRGFYGLLKAATVAWILLIPPLRESLPVAWSRWGDLWSAAAVVLVGASVGVCLLRAIPVLAEFVMFAAADALPLSGAGRRPERLRTLHAANVPAPTREASPASPRPGADRATGGAA